MLTRRRFICISAALVPLQAFPDTPDLHVETGIALGAKVTLRMQHRDARDIAALAMAELRRLEAIFSLYLPDSALSRLNRNGALADPPFELLECLTLAGAVHARSGGRFDPTVQPLWLAQAAATERGQPLSTDERAKAKALTGWQDVSLSAHAITLRRGMALTLNGIAQGFVADRVAAFLAGHGLTNALIDTGEMVALSGAAWPVHLADREIRLQDRALATSSPLGMTFGGDGATSHILDPATGHPVQSRWRSISVSAPSAALADALSTAACLTTGKEQVIALCNGFAGARLEAAVPL